MMINGLCCLNIRGMGKWWITFIVNDYHLNGKNIPIFLLALQQLNNSINNYQMH